MKTLTASDRKNLIRLASSLPKGDKQRRAILAGLKVSLRREEITPEGREAWEDGKREWWWEFTKSLFGKMNLDPSSKRFDSRNTNWSFQYNDPSFDVRGAPKHKGIDSWIYANFRYFGPDADRFTDRFDPEKFGIQIGLTPLADSVFDPKIPGKLKPGNRVWLDLVGSPNKVFGQMVGKIKQLLPPQVGLLPGQTWEPIVDPRVPSKDFQKQVKQAAQTIYNGFASRLPKTMSIPPHDSFPKSFGWKWTDRKWREEVRENGDDFPVKVSNLIKLKAPQIGYKFYMERADRAKGSPRAVYEISDANQKQADSILNSVIKSNEALIDSLGLTVKTYSRYPGAEIIFEIK